MHCDPFLVVFPQRGYRIKPIHNQKKEEEEEEFLNQFMKDLTCRVTPRVCVRMR